MAPSRALLRTGLFVILAYGKTIWLRKEGEAEEP
jgi:hypothetical protein